MVDYNTQCSQPGTIEDLTRTGYGPIDSKPGDLERAVQIRTALIDCEIALECTLQGIDPSDTRRSQYEEKFRPAVEKCYPSAMIVGNSWGSCYLSQFRPDPNSAEGLNLELMSLSLREGCTRPTLKEFLSMQKRVIEEAGGRDKILALMQAHERETIAVDYIMQNG